MSHPTNDIINDNMAEAIQVNEMIMLDAHEAFDADNRDPFNGNVSVEEVEQAYNSLGGVV